MTRNVPMKYNVWIAPGNKRQRGIMHRRAGKGIYKATHRFGRRKYVLVRSTPDGHSAHGDSATFRERGWHSRVTESYRKGDRRR